LSLFDELKRRNVFRVAAAYVVVAWLIIQVVETIFPAFGFGDAAVRIVTIACAIGLIPALIFAWAFELTPEGLKKEKDVDRSQSITPHTGKKLDRLIMVALALALGYFAFDKFALSESREANIARSARQEGRSEALVESFGDKSIAVLAFADMSPARDQEYLSDGIAEELLNLLAKIPELRVISRSSAFSFKGKNLELPEIAERLNVAHILEGSVRKSDDRVRITAQLIEARSDTQIWSETFDRTLEDIFAIQDEIAAAVVEQLKVTLLGAAPKLQETSPEAYALYLQARRLGRQFTAEGFEQSNALYQQALDIAPDYAAAWAGLAMNYNNQAISGQLPADESFALALEAGQKALVIDPRNALALSRLGYTRMVYENDLAAAARYMEQALEHEPTNPSVIGNAAVLLSNLGRQEQAIALFEYVAVHDPVSPVSHTNLGLSCIYAGRWEDAIASFQTALRLSPDFIGAHFYTGEALLFKGDAQAALASIQQEKWESLSLLGLTLAHHSLGQAESSDAALAELIENHAQDATVYIASAFAYRDEADQAFAWLEKAFEYGDQNIATVSAEPLFGTINNDPRWLPFLESIGKSPEQLDAIPFKVTLPK